MINSLFIHFWCMDIDLWPTRPPLPIGLDVQTIVDGVDLVAPGPISNHGGMEIRKR